MLRTIIIIGTASGLVLFSRDFNSNVPHPRMMGSLMTAIREFGQQTTGMSISYMELSNIAVSMVANEDAKIFCALFYDREDGFAFGRLICSEILNAFTQEYSSEFTQFGRNLKDFYGFQKKIITIVRFSPKSVLMKLSTQVGIKRVFLINDRDVIDTPGSKVDQLSVLANVNALADLCNGMSEFFVCMLFIDDECHCAWLLVAD